MNLRIAVLFAFVIFTIEAKKYSQSSDAQWQEFEEFLKWKKAKEQREIGEREIKHEKRYNENYDANKINERNQQSPDANPPPINHVALMARYIVNQADWAAVATISTRKEIESFPTATLVSFADGILGNGTGIPYLYLTPLDFTAQDLAKDNRASLLLSLAQGEYCKTQRWDPMDPRCARVIVSGRIKPLKNDSAELDVVKKLFFERHPKLENMPADHYFYFAKLKIMSIAVLDTFGGPKYVSVRDYLHPPVENVVNEFNRLFPLENYIDNSRQDYPPLNPVVRTV